MSRAGEVGAELIDEGGLADPGHTGDPDAVGTAGVGKQLGEQLLGGVDVIGSVRLHERDRPSERRSVAPQHPLRELTHGAGR